MRKAVAMKPLDSANRSMAATAASKCHCPNECWLDLRYRNNGTNPRRATVKRAIAYIETKRWNAADSIRPERSPTLKTVMRITGIQPIGSDPAGGIEVVIPGNSANVTKKSRKAPTP
mmetsp:Transcript_45304/g.71037  ORF Transcript_45304/g.71037 Transcript_45304/m.71037 type:complete len:117 (-) Transcript_45304:96-446(-)